MDTNIDNYSTQEIIKIIKLEDKCDLETLYTKIKHIISNVNNSNADNTDELKHFFANCFNKVSKNMNLVVPDYMLINLGIKSEQKSIPKPNNNIKTYTQTNEKYRDIVNRNNYPYSVPELLPNNITINSTNTKYPRGNVNPIKRETIKNILTINSKFRENYNEMTTDFSVNLIEPFNNVVSIKLSSVEMLNSYYTFSNYLQTNTFTITTYYYDTVTFAKTNENTTIVTFPEGNYNSTTIQSTLNGFFSTHATLQIVQVYYNNSKGKLYWRLKNPLPAAPPGKAHGFDIDFSLSQNNRDIFYNFGWLVGFRQKKYTFLEDYKQTPTTPIFEEGYNPESFMNFSGTLYYLLEIIDYNKNTSEVVKYQTGNQFTVNINDIIAKIPNVANQTDIIFEDSSDRIFKKRNYFGPIRLQKLRLRLLDENGKVVSLNNGDITVSLEIETLDVPYKNMT